MYVVQIASSLTSQVFVRSPKSIRPCHCTYQSMNMLKCGLIDAQAKTFNKSLLDDSGQCKA